MQIFFDCFHCDFCYHCFSLTMQSGSRVSQSTCLRVELGLDPEFPNSCSDWSTWLSSLDVLPWKIFIYRKRSSEICITLQQQFLRYAQMTSFCLFGWFFYIQAMPATFLLNQSKGDYCEHWILPYGYISHHKFAVVATRLFFYWEYEWVA